MVSGAQTLQYNPHERATAGPCRVARLALLDWYGQHTPGTPPMKLSLEKGTASHRIRAYDTGSIRINETDYDEPLIVMPETLITRWQAPPLAEMAAADFADLIEHEREIILLGTGRRQLFPPARLIADLARQGVGLEVMDTAAACRTYNVLMAEDRRVAAALLMIEADA